MSTTSTATYPDVLNGLAEVLQEVAGTPVDKVVPSASFDADLDVDSLLMVEVVIACEERFGISIPDEALEGMSTVGDAVQYIADAGVRA